MDVPTLNIAILAAGLGKRMCSDQPKVLHRLAGKPLLCHVLDTARALSPNKICIIFGHGGEAVPQAIDDPSLTWVQQVPQLGTGHALMQALPHLDSEGATLVLYGDVPLTGLSTLNGLLAVAGDETLAVLTVELADPFGYGRILRNDAGEITAVVEEKDASSAERNIREVSTGIVVIPNRYLHGWLRKLENNNAQKEYYLTDIVAMAVKDNVKVIARHPDRVWEISGINSKSQLAEL